MEWTSPEDGSVVRGKLSWKSVVTDIMVFVNGKGNKLAEMTASDVAELLRSGDARVIEDSDVPLMDRALNAMLDVLKRTDNDGEAAPEPA